jgi:HK97 family phage portal protein
MFETIKTFLNRKAKTGGAVENGLAGQSITAINGFLTANVNGIYYYKNWVYAAVSARAKRVADLQFEVYKKGERVYDHEILNVINDVDYEAVSSFLDLTGNCFLYIERYVQGNKPSKLYILHPSLVRPVYNSQNMLEIVNYAVGTAGKVQVPAEDIIHIKTFNPKQNYPYEGLGVSIVESIASSVQTDENARQWNSNFFKNSARPDGFLTTDKKLSAEEISQVRENFMSKYGGLENAHKIGLLSGGLDFKSMSLSQKDIDFVEQSKNSKDEILSAFGVPKSEIGLVEDVNRANAEASSYVFAKNTIDPIMKKITKALAKKLLPNYEDGLELIHVSIIPQDRVQILAERVAGVDKWLTRNEIRREDGLPEVEGGDTLYQGLALSAIATVPKKALKEVIEPDFKGLLDVVVAQMQIDEKKKSLQIENNIKSWLTIFKAQEPKFEKDIRKYFDQQEKFIIKEIKKIDKSFTIKQVRDIFKGEEWDSQISLGISFITPALREYLKQGADNASEIVGYDEFDDNTRSINEFIDTRAQFFSKSVNETTSNSLIQSLQEGLDNGESMEDMMSRVKEIYTFANDVRAKVIARTEISASANYGKIELYKQAGIEKIKWYNLDPESEECKMNAGEVREIGEEFPSGDTEPPAHPNCRSTTIAVTD